MNNSPEAKITRRKFVLGATFASVTALAAARRPTERIDHLGKNKLDELLPEQLGGWSFVSSSGLVVPPEDQLARALYSQLLTRVYAAPDGTHVMLLVAQSGSQTGILQIHRPEVCYTAGGYELSAVERHPVRLPWATVPAISLSATSDSRTEQLLYWTRVGNHLPASWREQRLAVARDNLAGVIPDAVLVRVSTINSNKPAALASIDHFVLAMMSSISPLLRKVLIP
jgi:EpsI family protein